MMMVRMTMLLLKFKADVDSDCANAAADDDGGGGGGGGRS